MDDEQVDQSEELIGPPLYGDLPTDFPDHLLATPDYDAASLTVLREAIQSTMAATDEIYASLPRAPMPEGASGIRVQIEEIDTRSPMIEISKKGELRFLDMMRGTLESWHELVIQIADAHLEQFMRPFWQHLEESTEAVGNTVDGSGQPLNWDLILDAYEKVEWGVDDLGRVYPPQITAGPEMIRKLRELPERTEEQNRRLTDMLRRKQEEHVSRRRSRKLRGKFE